MPAWSTRLKYWIEENGPLFLLRPYMRYRYRRRPAAGAADPGESQRVFTDIYHKNEWGDEQSRSGPGSGAGTEANRVAREVLPGLVRELGARTFLDAPCGDFAWMQLVDLGDCRYIGGDIVPDLVRANQERYGGPSRSFTHLDITRDDFPAGVDIMLVRDCFIHLSFDMIRAALANIKRNRVTYLLASTYPNKRRNWDIATGGFRPINLGAAPFALPAPQKLFREDVNPEHPAFERFLALWKVESLPV